MSSESIVRESFQDDLLTVGIVMGFMGLTVPV